MSHDAVTLKDTVLPKETFGGNDRVVRTQYVAPSTPDGDVADDPFKEFDLWAAGEAMKVLEAEYPGHTWRVVHDSAQGVCLISIPILMGVNRYMAVNLKTHALDSHRVKLAGGEILERYGLKRGRFELTPFLDAREKHSALVNRHRKVPE
jgi:hypothetical protein